MYRKNNHQKNLTGVVTVTADQVRGDAEKMVRRFIKKVKMDGILDEARERAYYKSPSLLNRERKQKRKRTIEKVNKKREELFKPRERFRKKRR
jgi:ribosomal protein S21